MGFFYNSSQILHSAEQKYYQLWRSHSYWQLKLYLSVIHLTGTATHNDSFQKTSY